MLTAQNIFFVVFSVCVLYIMYLLYERQKFLSEFKRVKTAQLLQEVILNRASINTKLEDYLDDLLPSLSDFIDYSCVTYCLFDRKNVSVKTYVNDYVNAAFVKTAERNCIESSQKYISDFSNIQDYSIEESVTGKHLLGTNNIKVESSFCLPLILSSRFVGSVTFSSKKKSTYTQTLIDEHKKFISPLLNYSLVLQELGFYAKLRDDYINMIIHDLRTPLTIIMGSADIMTKRVKSLDKKSVLSFSTDIKLASKRLLILIDNLLDVSRISTGRLKTNFIEADIIEFFKEASTQYGRFVEDNNLKYEFICPKTKIITKYDQNILLRILDNLVTNAVKYTQKGSVKIKVEKLPKNKLKVSVIDTGQGISKENIQKLFVPFQSLSSPYNLSFKTFGLGLTITKQLLEYLGSNLKVESTVSKGSKFYFVLNL